MDDLVALKREQAAAKAAMDRCGMANCNGLTLEEQVSLDLAYRKAQRRYHSACAAYNDAIERVLNG